jgi:hypothetical protein
MPRLRIEGAEWVPAAPLGLLWKDLGLHRVAIELLVPLDDLRGLLRVDRRRSTVVMVPSYSVRETRRVPCSQVSSRPWRSRVLPLAKFDGLRKTVTAPVSSSQRMMRLLGMSLHSR